MRVGRVPRVVLPDFDCSAPPRLVSPSILSASSLACCSRGAYFVSRLVSIFCFSAARASALYFNLMLPSASL